MTIALLSPVFNIPVFTDENGDPLAGAYIYAYEAGSSSILQNTYTGPTAGTANSNPIVLDSGGSLPAGIAIWLDETLSYNLVLTLSDGTTVLQYFDNVTGVPPVPTGGSGGGPTVWVPTSSVTYLTSTSFSCPTNLTAQFAVGNRCRLTLTSGYTWGTVTAVTYSSPNTHVTIVNDGAALDASISLAEYSVLTADTSLAGATVDAAGVSYFGSFSYTHANTVGKELQTLTAAIASGGGSAGAGIASAVTVWPTTGTAPTFVLTPTPAGASLGVQQIWQVQFNGVVAGAAATLNVSGLGALPLKQYSSTGTLVDPWIVTNQISEVAYDASSSSYILLDELPPAAAGAAPRGMQVFSSNGTFTVPASVFYIKVSAVGGGGGGGIGNVVAGGGESDTYAQYKGGDGGGAAAASGYISTTPGTTYSCSIGSGGTASTGYGSGYGGNGGTTSFGISLIIAPGGAGGQDANYSPGANGTPGSGGSGTLLVSGVGSAAGLSGVTGTGGTGGGTNGGGSLASPPPNPGVHGYIAVEW